MNNLIEPPSIEAAHSLRAKAYQLWKQGHYLDAYKHYIEASNAYETKGNNIQQIECLISSIGTLRPINAPQLLKATAKKTFWLFLKIEPEKHWSLRANFLSQFGQIMFDYDLYEQAVPWVNASYVTMDKVLKGKLSSAFELPDPSHEIGLYARRLVYVLTNSKQIEGVRTETVKKQAEEIATNFEKMGEAKEVVKTYHAIIRHETQNVSSLSRRARDYTERVLNIDIGDHEQWTVAVCKVNKGLGFIEDYNKSKSQSHKDDAAEFLLDGVGILRDRGICLPRHISWLLQTSLWDLGISSEKLPKRSSFPFSKSETDVMLRRIMT